MHRFSIFNAPQTIAAPALLRQSREKPFFNRAVGRTVQARNAESVTEIDIYDEIGFWGMDAARLRSMIRNAGDIRLRINSPGGDVFDGIAMFNDLVAHPHNVEVHVTGIAASAASLIAMAGDTVKIAENAFLMIHNAWAVGIGDKSTMRELGDVLDQVDGALAATYAARTGLSRDKIADMMTAETWIVGSDAVDQGFADELAELPAPSARFDLSGFHNAPRLWELPEKTEPQTFRDFERLLTQDAGLSRSRARSLLRHGIEDATQDAGDPSEDEEFSEFVAGFDPDFLNSLIERNNS